VATRFPETQQVLFIIRVISFQPVKIFVVESFVIIRITVCFSAKDLQKQKCSRFSAKQFLRNEIDLRLLA